jgi:hypothetical protein
MGVGVAGCPRSLTFGDPGMVSSTPVRASRERPLHAMVRASRERLLHAMASLPRASAPCNGEPPASVCSMQWTAQQMEVLCFL